MWINVKKYKHYDKLLEITPLAQQDFANWKQKYKYEDRMQVLKFEHPDVYPELKGTSTSSDLYHRPESIPDRPNPKENWFCDPCSTDTGKKIGPAFQDWKLSAPKILELPGIVQHLVNFVKPHSSLPPHDDLGGWIRLSKDTGRELNGFSVVLGLDTVKNKDQMGIMFNNVWTNTKDPRAWGTGEWVAFEGKTHFHDVFNRTDQWRVTVVVDIEYDQFDLSDEELEYLQNRWRTYKPV